MADFAFLAVVDVFTVLLPPTARIRFLSCIACLMNFLTKTISKQTISNSKPQERMRSVKLISGYCWLSITSSSKSNFLCTEDVIVFGGRDSGKKSLLKVLAVESPGTRFPLSSSFGDDDMMA